MCPPAHTHIHSPALFPPHAHTNTLHIRQTQWDPPTWEGSGENNSVDHESEMDLGTPTYDENPSKVRARVSSPTELVCVSFVRPPWFRLSSLSSLCSDALKDDYSVCLQFPEIIGDAAPVMAFSCVSGEGAEFKGVGVRAKMT